MKLTLNLELSEEEVTDLNELVEELSFGPNDEIDVADYFHYSTLEKVVKDINTSYVKYLEQVELSDKLLNDSWKTIECTCNHEAEMHAFSGTGLCCSEGCFCFKFIKKDLT